MADRGDEITRYWKLIPSDIDILITEPDEKKRELIGGLLFDEAERLHEDLEELRKNGTENNNECRTF